MNFFLFTNEKKDENLTVTERITRYICSKGGTVCVSEGSLSARLSLSNIDGVVFFSVDKCIEMSDAAMVIGGDGTILKAAKLLYGRNIPIIGVNLGTVGYMAEVEINECELLGVLFEPDYKEKIRMDERMMLSCRVERGGKYVYSEVCLNEVVVAKGDISRMIDIDLELDGEVLASYQCDGVIASTPTGSTAYSMSAGGAVIDPKVECISVIPLCPYLCINSSPIVFSRESEIVLSYRCVRGNTAYISVDGGDGFALCDGDRVMVSAAEHKTKLMRFKKYDFCKLLNTKLTHRASELAVRSKHNASEEN